MIFPRWVVVFFFLLFCPSFIFSATQEFSELHCETTATPSKEMVLKKVLFLVGLMNACYLGMNELVYGIQLAKETNDPKFLSGQLFSVCVGLEEKPQFFRYLSKEFKSIENFPGFPLGFPDSPEGPETYSKEMINIADHLEKLNIQFQSNDIGFLKKEADRIVFAIFWTDSEKIRTLCSDLLTFLRVKLKEDIPFQIYQKPLPRR